MEIIDRNYCCQGEALTLTDSRYVRLLNFINKNLRPIKTINYKTSSYGLKHIIEKRIGFYVSNADCKKAMTECGYIHDHGDCRNWRFNVSERSVKETMKMEYIPWEPIER